MPPTDLIKPNLISLYSLLWSLYLRKISKIGMEGVSARYKGFRRFWRRKDYERLDGSGSTRRRKNRIELATLGSNRRRRFWRIKFRPHLRFFHSPKNFFIRLRDAYVNMMIGFANSRAFNTGFGGGGNVSVGYGFGKAPLKDYDEKTIVQMYKSFVAQGQLVPRDSGITAGSIVCRQ